MKYHKTEAGRTKFWLVGKGMKLKCCLPSEVLTKPHKTSNLTQGKSPRMSCGGNLSGGENQQRTTKPCDGNQCTMMMQAVHCDGLGGWVWEIINRGRFDLVLVWGERVYVA